MNRPLMNRVCLKTAASLATCLGLVSTGFAEDPPLARPTSNSVQPTHSSFAAPTTVVQVAILLDTSNSMDGLIAQAKTELWRIVNEIAAYQKGGRQTELQVALYEYGKSTLPRSAGHLRQVTSLTTDLDRISEALFALTTNGGEEYCGQAIDAAVGELEWSRDPSAYKAIFVAGNEPFNQGKVDWRKSVKKAREAGIAVHTIHCGDVDDGIRGQWQAGAVLGLGEFMAIDQSAAQVEIATPYDDEIASLGGALNETYIGYGAGGRGQQMKARQRQQDSNAQTMSKQASVERAAAKAKTVYKAADWDLVDAMAEKKVEVAAMAPAALPPEMADMSAAERNQYVEQKAGARKQIKGKLADLDKKRQAYIAKEQATRSLKDKDTFDAAMRKALRRQLEAKGFVRR